MKNSPEPRWGASLATRLSLSWSILIAVAVGISALVLHRTNHRHLLETLRTGVERDVGGVRLKLETWAASFRQDVSFCAGAPLLREFLAHTASSEDQKWRGLLEEEFQAMLAGKPNYFQMRVLGIGGEDHGRELLRLDRMGTELKAMPINKLQSKSDRSYFREAMEMPAGEVYLSEINLNRDFGEISRPFIPTLRAAARVEALGREAMVIINADLGTLLGELEGLRGRTEELRLVGADGGYLLHPRPELTFPADLGGQFYFHDEYPDEVNGEEMIVGRCEVKLGGWPGRTITAMISMPEEAWRGMLADSRTQMLVASVLATLAGATGGILILLPLARRLRALARSLQDYEVGTEPKGLPASGPDEVGVVVSRFRELGARVRADVESLESARHEAEEATRTKEEFLAIMTHEIRTPMNAVVGLIRALGENQPPPHQGPLLSSLRAASSNLMALLNSALDYTKLKGGHIEFAAEDFDAAEVAREVGLAYAPSAMAKGLAFHLRVPEERLLVRGDPVRLRQVLNNLLANAVKFTATGSVSFSLEVSDEEPLLLLFTVEDTGPGVEASERERIFAPFAQASAASQRGAAGTGLGLSIARALIERQGGSLNLTSTPGEGAAFKAALVFAPPLSTVPTPSLLATAEFFGPFTLDGLHVLYVEDVEFNRLILEITLGGTGATLVFAESGTDALELAKSQSFDVALLDLQLPDFRGEVLAGFLREIQPNLPMLAVTAQASESVVDTCRAAGILGVVLKPYEPETLLSELLRVVKPSGKSTVRPVDRDRRLAQLAAENLETAAADLARAFREGKEIAEIPRVHHRLATTIGKYHLDDVDVLLASLAVGQVGINIATALLMAEATRLREAAPGKNVVS